VVSPEGIDHGKARPKADAVWLILSGEPNSKAEGREVVSLNFASWNQLDGWLQAVDGLRQAA
jgi:hypothetical protein